jgi:prepilin-type N-terminal cleavage/methylation domain-containing protein
MKGFTLIETLFSISLVAALAATLYGVLSSGTAIYMKDTALLDVEQQARNAMERIVQDVRSSKSHVITTISAGDHKIIFDTPTKTGLGYYKTGTQLTRLDPTGTTASIASDISFLTFSPLTGNVLTIVVTAQKTIYQHPVSFSLTQKVRLRNE